MGDLECGFEEMQGVKLGYLLIKGKQMFALSQVFTDLLKNIPRTTVHKRMDHLNVKKHHCDLEELRKLKAINSIAFHAAKCTLISREDVEALYFSCKTERVLKSNKRKVKASSPGDAHDGLLRADTHAGLWKEKVWFSLHSVPQTLSLQNKAGRREVPLLPDSKLPHFYSKSHDRDYQPVSKSNYKPFKNYETAQINGNCVTFNQRHSFFRSAVNRQPVVFQSAIAAQSKLSGSASDLLHKRKRRRDGGGGGRDSARHSWSRSRHTHHPPVLLVQPKCCSKPKSSGTGTLNTFHLGHDFYLNPRPHDHHHHHQPIFHESYSSDTESSTYSDRENNDSDFGSNFSTTSNSGSSDEEDEEDDSQSESSEVSSDEESSSQSDSSSVSSQVSVQSIRFRRARVASLTKTFNTKTPLVLQPTFHYSHHQQQQKQHGTLGHDETIWADYSGNEKRQKCDLTFNETRKLSGPLQPLKFSSAAVREGFLAESKRENVSEAHGDPKNADPVDVALYALGPNRNKASPQRRTPGHANKCPPGFSSHCDHDKDKLSKSKDNQLSLAVNLKREVKTNNNLKQPSPLKTIKTEAEEPSVTAGPYSDSGRTAKTPPFNLQNVKVKVEENYDEYEYLSQASGFQCKGDKTDSNNGQYPSCDIKQGDYFNNATKAIENAAAAAPTSPSNSQECRSTQDTPCIEEGEYKNGARVRKNYRTLVLGKKSRISRMQTKQYVSKVDKGSSSRPMCKTESCEGYTEHLPGASKRKRPISNVASPAKKPFSFMANFPSPPSLVVGSDGDLCPAYSMNSMRDPRPPPLSHPVWRWQPGGQPLPPPPAQRIRKC
ncbi:SKI/DACH domain-containing protein 1 [Polymixia lowei]